MWIHLHWVYWFYLLILKSKNLYKFKDYTILYKVKDSTNLFSHNEYNKNDKIILKYFQWFETKFFLSIDSKNVKLKKIYCTKCKKYRKLKNPKLSYIFDEMLVLSITCGKCGSNYKKYLKKKNQLSY